LIPSYRARCLERDPAAPVRQSGEAHDRGLAGTSGQRRSDTGLGTGNKPRGESPRFRLQSNSAWCDVGRPRQRERRVRESFQTVENRRFVGSEGRRMDERAARTDPWTDENVLIPAFLKGPPGHGARHQLE
jgi:hypothetical protein